VGLGCHLPERDALLVALLLVEAWCDGAACLWASGSPAAGGHGGGSAYDRSTSASRTMASANAGAAQLAEAPPQVVAGVPVLEARPTRRPQACGWPEPLG